MSQFVDVPGYEWRRADQVPQGQWNRAIKYHGEYCLVPDNRTSKEQKKTAKENVQWPTKTRAQRLATHRC